MTQEALKLALDALKWCHGGEPCGTAEAIAVVEKALAQEQEPFAYYHPHKGFYFAKPTSVSAPTIVDVEPLPLYTTPPQRTWVGLTDEDISKISQRLGIDHDDSWADLKQAIEAKLKEKNT